MRQDIDLFDDDGSDDFDAGTPWSLDELDRSADLGSVRSAWAEGADGLGF